MELEVHHTWWIPWVRCRRPHVWGNRSVWTRASRWHRILVGITAIRWHSGAWLLLLLCWRRGLLLMLWTIRSGSRTIRTWASRSQRWPRMLHVHWIGQVLWLLRLAAWLLLWMMHRLLLLLRLLVRRATHFV